MTVLAEKLVCGGLALGLVVALDWRSVILVMIVLGQGHFLTAYLYQALAGKITARYLANFVLWGVLIVATYWSHPFPAGLTALATLYFAFHMAVDELYLTRRPLQLGESPMHLGRALEILPLIALYSAAVSDAMLGRGSWPGFPLLLPPAVLLAGLGLMAYTLLVARGYRPDALSAYLLGAGLLLLGAAQQGWLQRVPAPKLSSFIILFHYFNWYLHYFLCLPAARRPAYLRRVTAVNALVLVLYFSLGQRGPGWVLFQEQNFYIWTLLHLITSTRAADLKRLVKPP